MYLPLICAGKPPFSILVRDKNTTYGDQIFILTISSSFFFFFLFLVLVRHDWTVDRCGKEVRYVIDYYEMHGAYSIDARSMNECKAAPLGKFFLCSPDLLFPFPGVA